MKVVNFNHRRVLTPGKTVGAWVGPGDGQDVSDKGENPLPLPVFVPRNVNHLDL